MNLSSRPRVRALLAALFLVPVTGLAVPVQAQPPAAPPAGVPSASSDVMTLRRVFWGVLLHRFVSPKDRAQPAVGLRFNADSVAAVPIPAAFRSADARLELTDTARGTVALLPVKPGEVRLTEDQFTLIKTLSLPVRAGERAVSDVTVTLKGKGGYVESRVLTDDDGGIARFDRVPIGPLTASVQMAGQTPIAVTRTPLRNEQSGVYVFPPLTVDWKDVKTLNPPAAPAANGGAGGGPVAASAAVNPNASAEAAPSPFAGLASMVVSLLVLSGIGYGVYRFVQSGKAKEALAGLQIETAPADAGAVAANPFQKSAPAPVTPITEGTADPFGNVGAAIGAAAPVGVSAGPRLVATAGVYSGQIFPLGQGGSIGRDPGNTIPLANDTNVSRRHADVSVAGGQATLTDNGSANGTFVNGVRIAERTPHPLRSNDEVTVGNTRFRYEG